ncbi:MlaA family lipoprotein [Roseateles amylovorans]|uniref:VacJ family lipoprotein n=1 Tax=Roseateles amylovorans TaxID=2978473 RepID=A0ABY6B814_9BURK|nr:VacJ family lipoprotein [Roseateles amylovorans]UXH79356.1 VacJ family lipoprotein [Roseateles amylovorans]
MTEHAQTGPRTGGSRDALRPLLLSAALLAGVPAFATPAPSDVVQTEQAQTVPATLVEGVVAPVVAAQAASEAASAADAASGPARAEDQSVADAAAAAAAAASDNAPAASAAAASAAEPAAAGQAGQAAQAASDAPAPGPRARNRLDPWENWNRKVFNFNEKLDENILRPVATAYSDLVPSPARQAVDNFFGNFSDAWSAVNLFLQGRLKTGAQQTMRVAVNSVFGLAGLIDIATPAGLEKNSEDLGRTLGYWGVKTGPYIVWPLLGPSSLRDSATLPANVYYSPAYLFDNGEYKVGITALQLINTRANLLRVTDMLDGIALDKYTFIRDAYLQRRNVKTHKEQEEDDDYEVITPDEKPAATPGR